jgi:hypothetical protein
MWFPVCQQGVFYMSTNLKKIILGLAREKGVTLKEVIAGIKRDGSKKPIGYNYIFRILSGEENPSEWLLNGLAANLATKDKDKLLEKLREAAKQDSNMNDFIKETIEPLHVIYQRYESSPLANETKSISLSNRFFCDISRTSGVERNLTPLKEKGIFAKAINTARYKDREKLIDTLQSVVIRVVSETTAKGTNKILVVKDTTLGNELKKIAPDVVLIEKK